VKVLTVVGARPQFVKAGPVSRALEHVHDEVIVHTGQHYDDVLSGVFLEEFGLEPDYHLGVGSGRHAEQTAAVMERLDAVVEREDPDVVLVYGDTNSTLGAALVAAKLDVRLAHVEAGLRSYNRAMPEEVNRVLTDHAADLLFAPTKTAAEALRREGVTAGVHWTGDVMYDALLWAREHAHGRIDVLDELGVVPGEFQLATVHRAGNTDDPARLEAIIDALGDAPLPVVFPAHPRTVEAMREFGLYDRADRELQLVEPVGYLEFVSLLNAAERVATDSGGVQKEAFMLDTPCVTLREETEWIETVEAGWNRLVGVDADQILASLRRPWPLGEKPEPYGDGTAAEKIVERLAEDAGPVERSPPTR